MTGTVWIHRGEQVHPDKDRYTVIRIGKNTEDFRVGKKRTRNSPGSRRDERNRGQHEEDLGYGFGATVGTNQVEFNSMPAPIYAGEPRESLSTSNSLQFYSPNGNCGGSGGIER
jgi:hypothetical protein